MQLCDILRLSFQKKNHPVANGFFVLCVVGHFPTRLSRSQFPAVCRFCRFSVVLCQKNRRIDILWYIVITKNCINPAITKPHLKTKKGRHLAALFWLYSHFSVYTMFSAPFMPILPDLHPLVPDFDVLPLNYVLCFYIGRLL